MILLFDMFCAQQMVIFQDSHLFFFQLDMAMTQTIGASAPIETPLAFNHASFGHM